MLTPIPLSHPKRPPPHGLLYLGKQVQQAQLQNCYFGQGYFSNYAFSIARINMSLYMLSSLRGNPEMSNMALDAPLELKLCHKMS